MTQATYPEPIWDTEAARAYDTPGTGMFASEIVGPTVDRLVALANDGPVLEFAIGTGRVAISLRDRGIAVTGIEQSPAMLAQLRTKADAAAIPVVLGDMARDTAPGRYTLVYLVYNTLSNLLTQADQTLCFHNAARHLTDGGRFVIELFVPALRRLPPGENAVVWRTDPGHLGIDIYDVAEQRLVSHHVSFGDGREARLFRTPHRYVWPAELDLMARMAGFDLESRHADWTGTAFTAESPSHVSVYRLAPAPTPDSRGDRDADGATV